MMACANIRKVRTYEPENMTEVKDKYVIAREDLLFPKLSFQINGILFDVAHQLGGGHREQYYERAVRVGLQSAGLSFREQVYVPVRYKEQTIGKYYLDFLVEEKIVLELKRGQFIPANVILQTKEYLAALQMTLGLVACFTHKGVFIKRIVNQHVCS